MCPHTIEDTSTNQFTNLSGGNWMSSTLSQNFGKVEKSFGFPRAICIDPLRMTGRQRSYITVKRKGFRHAPEQVEADDTRRVRIAGNLPPPEQRLNLRSKTECPAIVCSI